MANKLITVFSEYEIKIVQLKLIMAHIQNLRKWDALVK